MMQTSIGLIKRSATRWRLVSSEIGSIRIGHLIDRGDGRFEWRASGRSDVCSTFGDAVSAVEQLWAEKRVIAADETRTCPWCDGPLPGDAGPLMVFCRRSHANAARRAGQSDGRRRMRARRDADGDALSLTEKARARARARDRRRELGGD